MCLNSRCGDCRGSRRRRDCRSRGQGGVLDPLTCSPVMIMRGYRALVLPPPWRFEHRGGWLISGIELPLSLLVFELRRCTRTSRSDLIHYLVLDVCWSLAHRHDDGGSGRLRRA